MAPNNRKLREAVLAFPGWPSPSLTLGLLWDTPTPQRQRECAAPGPSTHLDRPTIILKGIIITTTLN
ncbi:hypothetical protein Pmani_029305 [Petrolisthes manimaculis]|uniref:Uncharacterized protein n=1 Tax=Petrolisthes manimaculis TaxID=1843537 RepID=A0AAE1NZM8_9EUCA|nr:hypothetical protein Pmani_029305 [Petrolisthes manimaculis]